jgi:hypothetical protein
VTVQARYLWIVCTLEDVVDATMFVVDPVSDPDTA